MTDNKRLTMTNTTNEDREREELVILTLRAFWRRAWHYRNDYGKEFPEKIPTPMYCAMGTAFEFVRKEIESLTATNRELVIQVDDLSMLVRRLARSMNKAIPDNKLSHKAMDYLKRHDLKGSVLRESEKDKTISKLESRIAELEKEYSDDEAMKIFMELNPSKKTYEALTITRWKDGIDIDEPTQVLRKMINYPPNQ